MKELIERLRLQAQVKSDAFSVPKEDTFYWDVANALERQTSRIAELEAELERYRSAPVVAWMSYEPPNEYNGWQAFTRLHDQPPRFNAGCQNIKKLIIKPEES